MRYLILLTLFILLALPKMGFYWHGVPVTVSEFLVLFTALACLFSFRKEFYSLIKSHYQILLSLVIASFCFLLVVYLSGQRDFKIYFIFIASSLAFPLLGLALAAGICVWGKGHVKSLRYTVLLAFFIVTVYGIAQFLLLNLTKFFFFVPHVTTTVGNVGQLLFQKDNNRGFVIKAISTYSNGNLLGANFLMWLPLVVYFSNRYFYVVKALGWHLAIFTFSRSIWAALVWSELLQWLQFNRKVKGFIFGVVLVVALVVAYNFLFHIHFHFASASASQAASSTNQAVVATYSFVAHASHIGGRMYQYLWFFHPHWLPNFSHPINPLPTEVVYAYYLHSFGVLGLALFVFIYFFTLFYKKPTTDIQRYCRIGMLAYLALMMVDGGFTLVPTQMIYWFIAGLYLMGDKLEVP